MKSSSNRIHKNLCLAVIDALRQIFEENKYSNRVLEKMLRSNSKWGSKDRAFIAETTYDIVRNWRLLCFVCNKNAPVENSSFWTLLGTYLLIKKYSLPNWSEFKEAKQVDINEKLSAAEKIRKVRESVPDWLDEQGEVELPDSWEKEIHSLNQKSRVWLRTNTLKTSRDKLIHSLKKENIDVEKIDVEEDEKIPDALILSSRQNLFLTKSFKDGLFEIQDAGSQRVAPALCVEPGMRVIDACAGAGGKSLHIASLMKNKGKIIALDTEEWRLNELKRRATRNRINIIETRLIDSTKVIKRLKESVDRVLLDVPCSGIGTLRRNPDIKWKLTKESFERVKCIQENILVNYSQMVKPGGLLVYSTCSIFSSENSTQIKKFLSETVGFVLTDEQIISPAESGYDGFYIAVLKKQLG